MNYDEIFMNEALKLAVKSGNEGEVPVGAVIVKSGEIISRGRNRREHDKNSLRHAEIEAIENACKKLSRWRLYDCELFVTLEPCPMCAGAIINSRIERVIFGAQDSKSGVCGSVINLFGLPFNHIPLIEPYVLEKECAAVMSSFFEKLRRKK